MGKLHGHLMVVVILRISLPKINCSKIEKQKQLGDKPGDVPIEEVVDCLAPVVPTFMS